MLTWQDLRAMPRGTRLMFPERWDIYPHCIVPAGTRAIVMDNQLAGEGAILSLLTNNAKVTEALSEWDGCVEFNPMNDGYEWTDESPVVLEDSTTEKSNA